MDAAILDADRLRRIPFQFVGRNRAGCEQAERWNMGHAHI